MGRPSLGNKTEQSYLKLKKKFSPKEQLGLFYYSVKFLRNLGVDHRVTQFFLYSLRKSSPPVYRDSFRRHIEE